GDFVWSHAVLLLVSGRLMVALFGAATVAVVCRIGKICGGNMTAIASGLLLAVSPLHVYYSKICVNDVVMVFFVALTLFLTVSRTDSFPKFSLLVIGLMAGLAAGAKYNGLLVLVSPLTACLLLSNQRSPT